MTGPSGPRIDRQAWLGVWLYRRSRPIAAVGRRDASREPPALPPFTELTPQQARHLETLVELLGRAGVFAPEVPDPQLLHPGLTDRGLPVTIGAVLRALPELAYRHPGHDISRYTANLAHHETHVEQWEDNLIDQIRDLDQLAGGVVPVEAVAVRQEFADDGSRRIPTQITLRVAGRPLLLAYQGTAKGLSTVLHVEVARALRAAGAPRRIAWQWEDDAVLAGLPDQDLAALNRVLGLTDDDGWEWVDQAEPYAAGDDA